ncbi:hypothetical protein [Arcticibacter eurypsychrophilus]|uniref:hypothetical protein n=1 Tax=Arcticibacter eurypsychrophilus TaxID=1434752 RepID=UPI00084CFCE7|nr:hypothetical protein [Arcticibacter eurypsychrophilus]
MNFFIRDHRVLVLVVREWACIIDKMVQALFIYVHFWNVSCQIEFKTLLLIFQSKFRLKWQNAVVI